MRRGLVDVATAKQQLEQQAQKLESRIPHLDDQARRAVSAGRDDLARVALERKRLALNEMDGLTRQIAEVEADKQRLATQERTLQVRIEQFRTHREVVSARYTAAEAEVRLKESLAGVSGELAELGMAVGLGARTHTTPRAGGAESRAQLLRRDDPVGGPCIRADGAGVGAMDPHRHRSSVVVLEPQGPAHSPDPARGDHRPGLR